MIYKNGNQKEYKVIVEGIASLTANTKTEALQMAKNLLKSPPNSESYYTGKVKVICRMYLKSFDRWFEHVVLIG